MEKLCDLHLHSRCSDGSMTPAELAGAVAAAGLSAAALTDHDTVKGVREFVEASKHLGFEGVAGVEISTHYGHLLGLFLPEASWNEANEWLAQWEAGSDLSHIQLAENLRADGYPIYFEELQEQNPGTNINRAHFALELCRIGAAESVPDAFKKFLGDGEKYYKSAPKPRHEEAIVQIRKWGGVPVMAHPVLNLTWQEIEDYMPKAKALGCAGAEVYYTEYSEEDTRRMMELCRKSGLLPSGGSDFHGDAKPEIAIGVGTGNLRIPYVWYETLKNA